MSTSHGLLGFFAGTIIGAAIGAAAGILVAPRAGAETRDMVNDAATDAWGNIVDAYQQGAQRVSEGVSDLRPNVDARTDELREKVDQARVRMDQLRTSLSQSVSQAADRVTDAVSSVAAMAGERGDVIIPIDDDAEVTDVEAGAPAQEASDKKKEPGATESPATGA